ncbi:MAG: ATP-binding cassette domain-containing protein [Clostridiaceae bacterium]|nr:ATP-binding cassette domain-containing protein [Clostridiaceae bacterium]
MQRAGYGRSAANRRRLSQRNAVAGRHRFRSGGDDGYALRDVSFGIDRNEFVFIIGPSGSGKTTLAKLLIREAYPCSGEVIIGRRNIHSMPRRYIPELRRKVGTVFQDFRLIPRRTVAENIAFALEIIGTRRSEIDLQVQNMLAMVGLRDRSDAMPDELSGGEQQRVVIARAMVGSPGILVADEPTGNLDPENALRVLQILSRINEQKTTVIVCTHDDTIVNLMQKRVIVIRDGVLTSDQRVAGYDMGADEPYSERGIFY